MLMLSVMKLCIPLYQMLKVIATDITHNWMHYSGLVNTHGNMSAGMAAGSPDLFPSDFFPVGLQKRRAGNVLLSSTALLVARVGQPVWCLHMNWLTKV
jgi:hypothetical protein